MGQDQDDGPVWLEGLGGIDGGEWSSSSYDRRNERVGMDYTW